MTSQENTDIEMEVDPLIDNHHHQPLEPIDHHQSEEPFDRYQLVEPLDHHEPEYILDHHPPVEPIDHHQSEEPFDRHKLVEPLDHHQSEEPFDRHQLDEPLDDLEPEYILDHHPPVEPIHHHQPEYILDHHQPVEPIDHHQPEDTVDYHQLVEPIDYEPEDQLDHKQQVVSLDHNQPEYLVDHHQVVEPLDQKPEVPLVHHQSVALLHNQQSIESLDHEQPVEQHVYLQPIESLNYHPPGDQPNPHQIVKLLENHEPMYPLDHYRHQPQSQVNQQYSESSYFDEEIHIRNYKLAKNNKLLEKAKDTQEKIIIAKSILQACKEDNEQLISGLPKLILQYFTKQPLHYLSNVVNDDKSEKISLKQAINNTKIIPTTVLPFINDDIRDIFIEYYVQKKQLPTKVDFIKSLHNKRDESFYKDIKIHTLVKNDLVKCHHLPKLNTLILTENPEFAYQRHLYLRQVTGFRSRGNKIIYVTVKKIKKDFEKNAYFLALAASSTDGLISKRDNVNFISDHDNVVGNDQIKAWIQCELLPKIASNSVIVLIQFRNKDNTPTHSSSKDTMIQWLQKRDIPVDTDSHKAQLYNLVKLYKKKFKETGFYDEVFRIAGLQVVICPTEYTNLDFFSDIYMSTTGNVSVNIVRQMKKLSQEEWTKMEAKIIEAEKQMMKDDNEMGRIIDNIFQMVKNGDVKEQDFPEGCRWTGADNFAAHIGDIIVD